MKKLIFTLPLIFATLTAGAQNSEKFTGSLLWKVSGNGLEQPSYIFGTHHLAQVSFAQEYPGFAEALNYAQQVVGEVQMEEIAAGQEAMMQHAVMPADSSYRTLLTEAEYRQLDDLLWQNLGTGLGQFEQFKPGIISQIFAIKLMSELLRMDVTKHTSIDEHVQNTAKAQGKKVLSLETAEDQIRAMFYGESLRDQAKDLICSFSNIEYSKQAALRLNALYANADLYNIYETTFNNTDSPCASDDDSMVYLNKERNGKWMTQLPGIFADAPSFVAVGLLHLCGQDGLLYQLDQLGYTIEAVN